MNDDYENGKIAYSGIGKDGFVSVTEDHWLTDMLENGNLLKNTSCGTIEFNFNNDKNESIDRR